MANGRISRLSAISDILKEDGKRGLSNARRDSKVSLDLEARRADLETRTIDGKFFFMLQINSILSISKLSVSVSLDSVFLMKKEIFSFLNIYF